ncbi:cysteine--tRNA ligase [Candidatus Woesearchaeota archaeon]|nr:cysteine--tRNA ligase [Candidatus Woesearchaeota archaeon]
MAIKLFNTLSRKTEVIEPIKKGEIGIYACGPTVYWFQHVGNLRTYISEDILRRTFQYNNIKVKHVINVTDVGHLTSDADEGEDKLLKALKREGLPLTKEAMLKLADKYFKEFVEDFHRLNILEPDVWCKATEHVNEMIELIKRIEANGYTYKTSVGLIFDTAKFKDYANLARLKLDELEQGARTKVDPERKNPSDFALWITNQPNHIMLWDSPWGRGFPGWHIECSAMSIKYLGEQFDIHCGGKEHIPVHHSNEIAQAEGATGKKPWVKCWFHTEWLGMKDIKMSKSKGDIIIVSGLMDKGYDPLDYRYFCLQAHYKTPLTFSFEALDAASTAYQRLKNKVLEIKDKPDSKDGKKLQEFKDKFLEHINNDLDTPGALALLWDLVKEDSIGNKEKYELILEFDKVLGLKLDEVKEEKIKVPKNVQKLVDERENARKDKDWAKSDELRDKIKESGFTVKDTKEGPVVKKG